MCLLPLPLMLHKPADGMSMLCELTLDMSSSWRARSERLNTTSKQERWEVN